MTACSDERYASHRALGTNDLQNTQIKAYDAETKRIQATAANMTPEQIQDIVMGTVAAALDTGDIVRGNEPLRQMVDHEQAEMQPQLPGLTQ